MNSCFISLMQAVQGSHVNGWAVVGIAFIVAMLVAIVCMIVGLFRRADRLEMIEEEAWDNVADYTE